MNIAIINIQNAILKEKGKISLGPLPYHSNLSAMSKVSNKTKNIIIIAFIAPKTCFRIEFCILIYMEISDVFSVMPRIYIGFRVKVISTRTFS